MEIEQTESPGLVVVKPRVFQDSRGFFMESYHQRTFAEFGITAEFVQDNHALSRERGVLRGLHFQLPPMAQAKLVRVTRGAVLDVVVDLRVGSPTYGRSFGFELSAENFKMLFVPKGFAHAYQTLEADTEFLYKVDAFYAPELDAGIDALDPALGIEWPVREAIRSEKDEQLPRLAEFASPFVYEQGA